MADKSVGRVIENLLRNEVIVVDLCRVREYAEEAAGVAREALDVRPELGQAL